MNRAHSLFEQENGLEFRDKELLRTAFVHSSFLNEAVGEEAQDDNERLEFLGDSILEFVVSQMLYARYPEMREGDLTSARASLVRRETLAQLAWQLRLGEYLLLGRGEEESGGRERVATLCATFEAVVGAIYLDQGLEVTARFVLPLMEGILGMVEHEVVGKDPKSRLQEWAQGEYAAAPRYKVLASRGPDHAKTFISQVTIKQTRAGVGRGRSKQESSQAAAAMALRLLGLPAPEYVPDAEVEREWPVTDDLPVELAAAPTA